MPHREPSASEQSKFHFCSLNSSFWFALTYFNVLRFPVECNTTDPGFNQFMNHTLGNTTEMECMFDYQWEDLDPQYNCSTKAYCAPPTPVNLMTTDYDDANGTFPLVEQTTVIT